ncbi:hypothetical protein [Aureimonas mangrovi]|uniref:hypothetical protein n=1 Tax=Aureimonas mangrovi TaxID=2758041 RepID=UPI00163D6AE1|nr:hypothetical protein [Aureimonas mangrovi]
MIPATHIFFDIETLPTANPDVIADIEASVRPPATMKKAETIARWEAEERPAAVAEAVAKTALDGGYGLVASIAWAIGGGPVVAATSAGQHGYDEAVERALIAGLFGELDRLREEFKVTPTLVGHCISSFDILFLWRRALVLGITPPHWWPVHAAPWKTDDVQDRAQCLTSTGSSTRSTITGLVGPASYPRSSTVSR